MKRTLDDAFLALDQRLRAWAEGHARPVASVFVYEPEQEPLALARFPTFANACAVAGRPVELIDVGQRFVEALRRRPGRVEGLLKLERESEDQVLQDLGTLGERYLLDALGAPEGSAVCRLLINTASLGAFVSYSAVTNRLADGGTGVPVVLAFPGEDDQRSLRLLGLRVDTNYRVPRI